MRSTVIDEWIDENQAEDERTTIFRIYGGGQAYKFLHNQRYIRSESVINCQYTLRQS
jgi:hypothetical protein